MANSIKNYKRKELRCVVVEDAVTGEVYKITNQDDMQKAIKEYSQWEVTKVYNPTQKQKNELWEMSSKANEENKITVGIEGLDMIIKAIPMLTDIEVDLTVEEDLETLQEVIQDPNRVMELVAQEVNIMLLDITNDYITNLKTLAKIPQDLINAIPVEGK